MPSDRFNREMDEYLKSRRRRQGSDATAKRRSSDSGISIEVEGPGFWEKFLSLFETIEDEREREPPSEELSEREMRKLEKTLKKSPKKEPQVVVEDEHGELQVPKPSFVDRLMGFLGFGEESPEEEFEDFNPEDYALEESDRVMFEEDVKEVIKISHKWIEELPAKKKKKFKESADFVRYKDLLDKLGLLAKNDKVDLDEDL